MSNNPFITEVKTKEEKWKYVKDSERFQRVRSEHRKLMEVVAAFGQKVSYLQDKQRQEYTQAYEHHMINVQKELHALREKATAIANDRTRDEKLKKLDADTQEYRNEALRLDINTNEMKKTLRTLTGSMHSIERERDWLLERLREAKRTYKLLQNEHAKLSDTFSVDGGSSYYSNDSSLTYDLPKLNPTSSILKDTERDWRTRLNTEFVVNREDALILTAPQFTNTAAAVPMELRPKTAFERKKENKKILGEIVTARAKQEGIRDFLTQCRNSAVAGSWASKSLSRRRLADILQDAQIMLVDGNNHSSSNETRMRLAEELCSFPEFYESIKSLLAKKNKTESQDNFMSPLGGLAQTNNNVRRNRSIIANNFMLNNSLMTEAMIQNVDGKLLIDLDVIRYLEDCQNDRNMEDI